METFLRRNFKVEGNIACMYKPLDTAFIKQVENIEVQLWHKGPMVKVFLGSGLTDSSGNFIVEFEANSPANYIVDGKISDVFLEAYYNGERLHEPDSPDLLKGLVAYWKLDEVSGTIANDATKNWHTGTLLGTSLPEFSPGKINNGLTFYGGTSGLVESYLAVGSSDDFNFGTGDFTYAFWMNMTIPTDSCTIIDTGFSLPGSLCLEFTIPDIITVYIGGTGLYLRNQSIDGGVWNHITIRRIDNQLEFFINGVSLGSETCTGVVSCPADTLLFGKYSEDWQNFDGMLDEIGIWKGHGLTDEEVKLLYNNGAGRQYPF